MAKQNISKPATASTAPRNTPVPPSSASPMGGKRKVSREMIAKCAYEIYVSGKGGSAVDNWLKAERELKG